MSSNIFSGFNSLLFLCRLVSLQPPRFDKTALALQQTCANIAEKVLLAIQIINAVVFFKTGMFIWSGGSQTRLFAQAGASPLRAATDGNASSSSETRRRRSPACANRTAWSRRGGLAEQGGRYQSEKPFLNLGTVNPSLPFAMSCFARPATCKLLMRIPIVTARWSEK
jgi:hypothetical protein